MLPKRTLTINFEYSDDWRVYQVEAVVDVRGDDYNCSHHDCHDVNDTLWEAICRKAEEKAIDQDAASVLSAEAEDRMLRADLTREAMRDDQMMRGCNHD